MVTYIPSYLGSKLFPVDHTSQREIRRGNNLSVFIASTLSFTPFQVVPAIMLSPLHVTRLKSSIITIGSVNFVCIKMNLNRANPLFLVTPRTSDAIKPSIAQCLDVDSMFSVESEITVCSM